MKRPLRLRMRCIAFALLAVSTATQSAPIAPRQQSSQQFTQVSLMDSSLAAGKVRASSQRVARLYLESAYAFRPERTRIALEREIQNVESGLAALRTFSPADDKAKRDLRRAIESLTQFWAELKPVVSRRYAAENTQLVYDVSEQMYIYASKVTFLFEDVANSEAGYMVDVSGRLQSMSERISKAAIYGIATRRSSATVDFITWKKEYLDSYAEIAGSPLNDDYQRRNLTLGKTMWALFDDILTSATSRFDATRILDISKCADGMWDIAQSSQATYVAAFKQGVGNKLIARNNGSTS